MGGNCAQLDVADSEAEWVSFDCCAGHSAPGGEYHYHFPPSCLLAQVAALSDGHSPQIGWALDGFPIYGPRGAGGVEIRNCGASGADATFCQDECGGFEGELSGVDEFTYRYYLTGKVGDLNALPSNPKPDSEALYAPYTIDCFRGCTHDEMAAGTCSGVYGYTTSHSASAHTGYASTALEVQCLDGETTYGMAGETTPRPTVSPTISPSPRPTPRPAHLPTVAPTTETPFAAPTRRPSTSSPSTGSPIAEPSPAPTTARPSVYPGHPTAAPVTPEPTHRGGVEISRLSAERRAPLVDDGSRRSRRPQVRAFGGAVRRTQP